MEQLRILSYVCDARVGERPDLPEDIRRGIESGVDVISAQGNGLDGGPQYLGSGSTPPPRREGLEPAIYGAMDAGIPFVLSLGGRAGADVHVKPYLDMLDEIAHDRGRKIRVAFISGEIDKEWVKQQLADGVEIPRLFESERLSERLTAEDVDAATRLQAQMGAEPVIEALKLYEAGEVDGVLTGRALDVGIHMAYPLLKGFPVGASAHVAKVVECGTLCCTPSTPFSAVIGTLGHDGSFTVEPVRRDKFACTPKSVASHALYERENPFVERNPGGVLDIESATYLDEGDSVIRVSGASWEPAPYGIKLEGARVLGEETACIGILREQEYMKSVEEIAVGVTEEAIAGVARSFGFDPSELRASMVMIGTNGAALAAGATPPDEVALLIRTIAPTTKASYTLCNTIRVRLNMGHFPGRKTTAANLAFPFSNNCFPMGPAYVFNVWHLLPLENPLEPFPIQRLEFPRSA